MLIWPKILLILHPSVWNLTTHITIQYIVESIPHGLIVVESVEKKEKRKRAKRKDVLCFVSLFYHCTALLFPVAKVLRCHSNHAESRKVPKQHIFFSFLFKSNEAAKKKLTFWIYKKSFWVTQNFICVLHGIPV